MPHALLLRHDLVLEHLGFHQQSGFVQGRDASAHDNGIALDATR